DHDPGGGAALRGVSRRDEPARRSGLRGHRPADSLLGFARARRRVAPESGPRGISMAQSQPQSRAIGAVDVGLDRTDAPAPPSATELAQGAGGGAPRLAALGGNLTSRKQRSLWGDAWRRLVKNKLAVIGLIIVSLFTVLAVLAPV